MSQSVNQSLSSVFGNGTPDSDLTPDELCSIVEQALSGVESRSRVLAIIPDKTRDDNTDLLFPFASQVLSNINIEKFDALVAQGTHAPMTQAEKLLKIGVSAEKSIKNLDNIFDHQWNNTKELITIGELSAERMREITEGLIDKSVSLTINRLLSPDAYDTVFIFGGVVPHEVAGFAGGAKYFFPGVAGAELTHATHWLGALATIENVIGRVETPTRHLIEAAADFLTQNIISFSTVVTRDGQDRLRTHALFAGDFRLAFRKAAEVSRKVHIKYTGRKYKRVVALLDEHYDELWVGGKASYKLGSIIEEGGELIIYAPHLRSISDTHGEIIKRCGYAPLETVIEMMKEFSELQNNLCVAAHLAHVSYASRRDENNRIVPRYKITLASDIDEETCGRVNLGFMDWQNFRRKDYEDDMDTLIVEKAGRDLYLVAPT